MKRITIITAAFLLFGLTAGAKISLPSVISDNMVLQQQTDAAIWGKATPGSKVSVTVSWSGKTYSAKADAADGKWLVRVATPKAGGPYRIKISDGTPVTLENVLIGEVWLCSGQSNMEQPMRGYNHQPVEGAFDLISRAKESRPIRMCSIKRNPSVTPAEQSEGSWQTNSPAAVAATSATAYFFAEQMQATLDVPIGILVCCYGGSTIETWLPRDYIEQFHKDMSTAHLDPGTTVKEHYNNPCMLYNGMLTPIIPYTIKGVIWYQGESNRGRHKQYVGLQMDLVKMFRERFEVPDAPFYCVQIAPYNYGTNDFTSGYLCEAQQKAAEQVEGCGFVTTCDVGAYNTIHPSRKKEVGQRLAFQALKHNYGQDYLFADAPVYEKVKFEGGKAYVQFKTDFNKLAPMRAPLTGFEIAGKNKVFYPAEARIELVGNDDRTVTVWSPEVSHPVAVRYCFRNWCEGNLTNCAGVPAAPFRTDDWDIMY